MSALEGTVATAAAAAAAAAASKAGNLADQRLLPRDQQHLGREKTVTPWNNTLSATSAVPVKEGEKSGDKVQGAPSQGGEAAGEASPTGSSHQHEVLFTVTMSESRVPKAGDGDGREERLNRRPQPRRQRRRADGERGDELLDTTESHVEGRNRPHNGARAEGSAAAELEEEQAQFRSSFHDHDSNISPRRNRRNPALTRHRQRGKLSGNTGGGRKRGRRAERASLSPSRDRSRLSPEEAKARAGRGNRETKTPRCNEHSVHQAQLKESFGGSSAPSSTSSFSCQSSFSSARASSARALCSTAIAGHRQHEGDCSRRIKQGGAGGRNRAPSSNSGGRSSSPCAARVVRGPETSLDEPELHGRAAGAAVMANDRGLTARGSQMGWRKMEDDENQRRVTRREGRRSRHGDYEQPSNCRMAAGAVVAESREFGDADASVGLLNTPVALNQPRGDGISGNAVFFGGHRNDGTSGTSGEDGRSRDVKESRHRSETEEKISGSALENAHHRTRCDAIASSMHTQNKVGPSSSSGASRSSSQAYCSVSWDSIKQLRRERAPATSKPKHCFDQHLEHPHSREPRGGVGGVARGGDPKLLLLDGGVRKESIGASGDDGSDALVHRLEELRKEKEVFRAMVVRGGT